MSKSHIDQNGYLRFNDTNRLIHRWMAYTKIYKKGFYLLPFSNYQIHHIDGDKLNNDACNLQLLTRGKHRRTHHIKHPFIKFLEWLFGK